MVLSNIQKQKIVSKIRNSNTFKNAPTSNALLQYLHEATLKGTNLKETVIDIEFFGNKEPTEKSNPRVRVNVYNLRKKLTAYYDSEGKHETWQVLIDKGQYEIRFLKKPAAASFFKRISWAKALPYLGLLVAITALIYTNTTPKTPRIWKSFISTKAPTTLFIGDHFGISGKTITGNTGWTRDFKINSVNEFYLFIDKNPELKNIIKPANYTYTTRMGALATQQFQRLYQYYNKNILIKFSTLTSISDIKEGNAIYAGPIKNKNKFTHFLNQANPYIKLSEYSLHISNHPTIKDTTLNLRSSMVDEEYAIVSKYPSIGDTEHFVFFSEHDIGVSATAEYFTNKDSLMSFTNTYLKNKKYFTAIFKVKGQNRTNTDIKLENVIGF